ncbi:MAG: DUF6279 family lipoprotein [Chromatiales bacterium]|nr:DUF6279 family lipoprotein [Chromatiales bacterium]
MARAHAVVRPFSFRTALRGLALVSPALLLASCSAIRRAYSPLDRRSAWRLAEVVTLTAERRTGLDARLRAHLAWHCRTQLPAYAGWLRASPPGREWPMGDRSSAPACPGTARQRERRRARRHPDRTRRRPATLHRPVPATPRSTGYALTQRLTGQSR